MSHSARLRAVEAVRKVLNEAAENRAAPDWVERERVAVAAEANRQALANGWRTVTVDDVERVEPRAMGHIDYVPKLALYVMELTWAAPEDTPKEA